MTLLLSRSQVCEVVNLRPTSIYSAMENEGFPQPLKIGKAARWVRSDIEQWIAALNPNTPTGQGAKLS